MKFSRHLIPLLALLSLALASLIGCSRSYDASVCSNLSEKISSGQELTQDEYARMIEQYDFVLEYLVHRTDSVMLIDNADQRSAAGQKLRNDKDFRERWEVMFDFGSTLYRARAAGRLSDFNLNNYMELLPYTDRISSNMASI